MEVWPAPREPGLPPPRQASLFNQREVAAA